MKRSRFFAALALSSCTIQASPASPAGSPPTPVAASASAVLVNRDHRGLALAGYDPVGYFTDGEPVLGDPALRAVHEGAIYHFASDEHRWQFLREPQHYAPAFGGFCGYAASLGRVSPASPLFWQILDGKLVVQHNQTAFDLFNQAPAENLARAERNWPTIASHNALPAHYVVNVDREGVAIAGFDPISYFEGAPALGVAAHVASYGGARYQFTTEQNRARFEGDPARYAPLVGGFCGYAASLGVFAPIDPQQYTIVDGHLILQRSAEALSLFNQDPKRNLARAMSNWPSLLARAGL